MVLVGGESASQEPLALGKASSPTSLLLCLAQSYLVKLEGHANPRCHHSVKQVHVSKDPLITRGGDTKVPLEQGMQAIEEGLQAGWGENINISNRAGRGCSPSCQGRQPLPHRAVQAQARLGLQESSPWERSSPTRCGALQGKTEGAAGSAGCGHSPGRHTM